MKDRNSLKLNILTVLVVIMLAALAAQSVAIYRLSERHGDATQPKSSAGVEQSEVAEKKSIPSPMDRENLLDEPLFDFDIDKWDPFKEMQSMNDRIDRMFGSAFNRFRESDDFSNLIAEHHAFSPDLNIEEMEKEYVVTMDLPGTDDSSININLEGQTLTVSGTSDASRKVEDGGRVIMQERRSGQFKRSVNLPGPVKADEMDSSNENGVLRITIPKEEQGE